MSEISAFDHIWYWRSRLPERKGQGCAVLVRGGFNSVLVRFEDGTLVVTSRYAVRRASGAGLALARSNHEYAKEPIMHDAKQPNIDTDERSLAAPDPDELGAGDLGGAAGAGLDANFDQIDQEAAQEVGSDPPGGINTSLGGGDEMIADTTDQE